MNNPAQAIKIDECGKISGMEMKDLDRFLDLKEFGPAEVKRASEIKWNPETQSWYVEFLIPELQGVILERDENCNLFQTYHDAEVQEIQYLTKHLFTICI